MDGLVIPSFIISITNLRLPPTSDKSHIVMYMIYTKNKKIIIILGECLILF